MNDMSKALVGFACLFLNGCFYQTVTQWDIERAVVLCGKFENVVEITASFEGTERVTCKPDNKSSVF